MIRGLASMTLTEGSPVYGCTRPTPPATPLSCSETETNETFENGTITDLRLRGGAHDLTFKNVCFANDVLSSTVLMTVGPTSYDANIYNISFENCVFETHAGQGDNFHMLNYSTSGKVVYNLTFSYCWFEPNSRMSLEMNGRGGWWHDVTIDHCTFEGGLGEIISADMFPTGDGSGSVYGVTVGGVVRGVESLVVTNNLIYGTGTPSVNGYTQPAPEGSSFYSWRKGIELGCVYPYASNNTVGRSTFSSNKVGRCLDSFYQTNYSGASYMTFANNVFDHTYYPHGCPDRVDDLGASAHAAFAGISASNFAFTGNEYTLGSPHNALFVTGYSGTDNAYSGERYTTSRGSISANFNVITNSTFEDCDFGTPEESNWPSVVYLGSGCTYDTDCYFKSGRSGGTPA